MTYRFKTESYETGMHVRYGRCALFLSGFSSTVHKYARFASAFFFVHESFAFRSVIKVHQLNDIPLLYLLIFFKTKLMTFLSSEVFLHNKFILLTSKMDSYNKTDLMFVILFRFGSL